MKVSVFVKIREEQKEDKKCIRVGNDTTLILNASQVALDETKLHFENVFSDKISVFQMYQTLHPKWIQDLENGYNVIVCAFGLKKGGKSYMLHSENGMIAACMKTLRSLYGGVKWSMGNIDSYGIKDVLKDENTAMRNSSRIVTLDGLSQLDCGTGKEAIHLYSKADYSHEQHVVTILEVDGKGFGKRKIHFIDMHGSVAMSTPIRKMERPATYEAGISDSFLKAGSVLHRLYCDMFSGNYKTNMLLALRSSVKYQQQVIQTLLYAYKLKECHTNPKNPVSVCSGHRLKLGEKTKSIPEMLNTSQRSKENNAVLQNTRDKIVDDSLEENYSNAADVLKDSTVQNGKIDHDETHTLSNDTKPNNAELEKEEYEQNNTASINEVKNTIDCHVQDKQCQVEFIKSENSIASQTIKLDPEDINATVMVQQKCNSIDIAWQRAGVFLNEAKFWQSPEYTANSSHDLLDWFAKLSHTAQVEINNLKQKNDTVENELLLQRNSMELQEFAHRKVSQRLETTNENIVAENNMLKQTTSFDGSDHFYEQQILEFSNRLDQAFVETQDIIAQRDSEIYRLKAIIKESSLQADKLKHMNKNKEHQIRHLLASFVDNTSSKIQFSNAAPTDFEDVILHIQNLFIQTNEYLQKLNGERAERLKRLHVCTDKQKQLASQYELLKATSMAEYTLAEEKYKKEQKLNDEKLENLRQTNKIAQLALQETQGLSYEDHVSAVQERLHAKHSNEMLPPDSSPLVIQMKNIMKRCNQLAVSLQRSNAGESAAKEQVRALKSKLKVLELVHDETHSSKCSERNERLEIAMSHHVMESRFEAIESQLKKAMLDLASKEKEIAILRKI